ncbi:MAG TPA: GNAT family N-acetyltransferase, partial [Devosia sp.]|nr:GNAT family N-acetyltransferase [Devosia sp.]
HSGLTFHVRPARPEDEAALGHFFEHVTPEDLRFRFLSSVKAVSHDQLVAMTRTDHRQTESFVAFELGGGPIIGTAMLACDAKLEVGEVAISVSADHRNLGIGWELLRFITRYAEAKGVNRLQSLESRSNTSAIQLEKELGFTSESYPGDSTLVMLQKTLAH